MRLGLRSCVADGLPGDSATLGTEAAFRERVVDGGDRGVAGVLLEVVLRDEVGCSWVH